ncbi:MAG: hypothetical protein O2854_09505 [Chloroflexi bacterium]|nr:hypothetical protein [Chloroflexota bacterium]
MKLTLYENGESARFGDSVSVDGSIILVGAPGDATHLGESRNGPRGEVYIYTLTKNGVLQSRLQADREGGHNFGAFVQANENSVIVGGRFPGLHESGDFSGIWMFDKESYDSYTSLGIVGFIGPDLSLSAVISTDGETIVTRGAEATHIYTRN